MRKITNIILLLLSFHVFSQEMNFNEDKTITLNRESDFFIRKYLKSGFALDHEDNKIIVGGYDGSDVDFGNANFISAEGNANAYIAKYDKNNELLWLKNLGGSIYDLSEVSKDVITYDFATDVAIDSENNIYTLATIDVATTELVDLDPEHETTNSIIDTNRNDPFTTRNLNVFLIKYSPTGKLLWHKEIFDGYDGVSLKLIVDANDHVFFTGYLDGITGNYIDFDTSKEYLDDRDIIQNRYLRLSFIAEYDKNGNYINATGIDGNGTVDELNVKHSLNNTYASGTFSANKSDFFDGLALFKNSKNPTHIFSKGDFNLPAQNNDIFIAKYNNDLNEILWVNTISSVSGNRVQEIMIDKNENVYVSGYINGSSVDFDIHKNLTTDIVNASSGDVAFIAKYNALDGSLHWVKTIGGGSFSRVRDMAIKNDKIVLGGEFKGTINIGDAVLNSTVTNPFIAVIDTDGNWGTVGKIKETSFSSVSDVIIANDGIIHYFGYKGSEIENNKQIVETLFMGTVNSKTLSSSDFNIKEERIYVSPNPTTDYINIHIKEGKHNIDVKMFNYIGQTVFSKKGINVNDEIIDIRAFSEGVYLLQLQENGKVINTFKIIKN